MHYRSMMALVALSCALTACEQQMSGGHDGETEVTADAMGATRTCVDDAHGYSVEYPATWHVDTEGLFGACSLFDPDPVTVPVESEVPLEIAIQMGIASMPAATLTGDVMGRRNLQRERFTVAGRDAVRIEGETTGEGLHSRGIRMVEFFVDLGERTLGNLRCGQRFVPAQAADPERHDGVARDSR
jgi:hypothetical protein